MDPIQLPNDDSDWFREWIDQNPVDVDPPTLRSIRTEYHDRPVSVEILNA